MAGDEQIREEYLFLEHETAAGRLRGRAASVWLPITAECDGQTDGSGAQPQVQAEVARISNPLPLSPENSVGY